MLHYAIFLATAYDDFLIRLTDDYTVARGAAIIQDGTIPAEILNLYNRDVGTETLACYILTIVDGIPGEIEFIHRWN